MSSASASEIPLDEALGLQKHQYESLKHMVQWKAIHYILKNAIPGQVERTYDLLQILVDNYEGNQNDDDPDSPELRMLDAIVTDTSIENGLLVSFENHLLYASQGNMISRFRTLTLDLHQVESYLPTFLGSIEGVPHIFCINPLPEKAVSCIPLKSVDHSEINVKDILKGLALPLTPLLQEGLDRLLDNWRTITAANPNHGNLSRAGQVTCRVEGNRALYNIDLGSSSNDMARKCQGLRSRMKFIFSFDISDFEKKNEDIPYSSDYISLAASCDKTVTTAKYTNSQSGVLTCPSNFVHLSHLVMRVISELLCVWEKGTFVEIDALNLPDLRIFRPRAGLGGLTLGYSASKYPLAAHCEVLRDTRRELLSRFEKMQTD